MTGERKELKTVKTDDLNVEENAKETQRDHAIPGQIKRDTAANIAGGKQVRTVFLYFMADNSKADNICVRSSYVRFW